MGTTLTGTTPQDTYDSLIKVTDNGPLSGTAKYLSDGLGNDSALALSTAAVGVGTASPNAPLEVQADSGGTSIRVKGRAAANSGTIRFFNNASSTQLAKIESSDNSFEIGSVNNVYAAFLTNGTEQMRITSAGNVGIGTSSPTRKLTVVGDAQLDDIVCTTSIYLGGTAAANALDDYEEGTWTPVLRGASTAGTYEQATTYATYTKIGRQVTLNCYVQLAGSITGGGTAYAIITGLPFAKSANQLMAGSVYLSGVDFTGSFVSISFTTVASVSDLLFVETRDNDTTLDLPISGFSANDVFSFSITYNV